MARSPAALVAQALRGLALACAIAASLGLAAIVCIISASVVMRKLGTPLHVTEEVVGLLLSVSLLLALPMVTLRAQHVRVALLYNATRGAGRRALQVLGLVLSLVFFGWLMIEIVPWFEFAFDRNLKTQTSRLLLYPWMAVMPVTVALTMAILLARLTGLLPEPQPEAQPGFTDQGETPT
ncbi:TRAP transporter small permease [Tropicimonas sediminicola]|uniref:TRAP transporter small permease protein n=1 Tax=Tropicimonas sediminicola TaxID=1031541 RepID=A0A239IYC0_9RHOB|nr:TRAP transporter small permease subunit [Tropicimonas sediminicola]SNS98621.1 TRAP-type C4-dicarboxylate transport system, small permease component [Tropicimonas sediminicola]